MLIPESLIYFKNRDGLGKDLAKKSRNNVVRHTGEFGEERTSLTQVTHSHSESF